MVRSYGRIQVDSAICPNLSKAGECSCDLFGGVGYLEEIQKSSFELSQPHPSGNASPCLADLPPHVPWELLLSGRRALGNLSIVFFDIQT